MKSEVTAHSVLATTIPTRIKIRREENYHTHYIGKSKDGKQFIAFIVAASPSKKAQGPAGILRWYAVLHQFDSEGRYDKTQSAFLGAKPFAHELKGADAILMKLIRGLGRVSYRDVEVELFSIKIDGHIFGLVDASAPKDGYVRVDLQPNQLSFFPPWDGTYST